MAVYRAAKGVVDEESADEDLGRRRVQGAVEPGLQARSRLDRRLPRRSMESRSRLEPEQIPATLKALELLPDHPRELQCGRNELAIRGGLDGSPTRVQPHHKEVAPCSSPTRRRPPRPRRRSSAGRKGKTGVPRISGGAGEDSVRGGRCLLPVRRSDQRDPQDGLGSPQRRERHGRAE